MLCVNLFKSYFVSSEDDDAALLRFSERECLTDITPQLLH